MSHDVLILGAGPAGSAAARRLASSGVRVALVGLAQRPGLEGVSDRSRALLVDEGIESAGALLRGPVPRRGCWAGRTVEGREWLVERAELAEALRRNAVRAGASLRRTAAIRVMRQDGEWRVSTREGDTLAAPVLIEARGRRGAARRGPVLLCFSQRFRRRGGGESATHVEPADFGWCWWAEHQGTLWVQTVADPRSGHPRGWIAAAARRIPALARALDGAIPEGPASACAAYARIGRQEPSAAWRAGDAAVAVDPLSGQGIYHTLKSARLVASAVLSVMNGSDAALAERFVAQRHRETFERGARTAADLYRANLPRGEFWARTADAYEKSCRRGDPLIREPAIGRRPAFHLGG